MKNDMKEFETSDFGLIVFLSLEFPIIYINRTDPRRAKFMFTETKELNEAIADYWSGDAYVSPQKYHIQTKIIKARIYENA